MLGQSTKMSVFFVLSDWQVKTSFVCIADLPDSHVLVILFVLRKAAEQIEPKYNLATELHVQFLSKTHQGSVDSSLDFEGNNILEVFDPFLVDFIDTLSILKMRLKLNWHNISEGLFQLFN